MKGSKEGKKDGGRITGGKRNKKKSWKRRGENRSQKLKTGKEEMCGRMEVKEFHRRRK